MAKRVSEKKLVVSPATSKAPSTRKVAPSQRTTHSAAVVETPSTMDAPDEAVAALAYSYWVGRGYQGGSPEEDWLRAERELRVTGRVSAATA